MPHPHPPADSDLPCALNTRRPLACVCCGRADAKKEETPTDPAQVAAADLDAALSLIGRGVAQNEARFVHRAVSKIVKMRRHLSADALKAAIAKQFADGACLPRAWPRRQSGGLVSALRPLARAATARSRLARVAFAPVRAAPFLQTCGAADNTTGAALVAYLSGEAPMETGAAVAAAAATSGFEAELYLHMLTIINLIDASKPAEVGVPAPCARLAALLRPVFCRGRAALIMLLPACRRGPTRRSRARRRSWTNCGPSSTAQASAMRCVARRSHHAVHEPLARGHDGHERTYPPTPASASRSLRQPRAGLPAALLKRGRGPVPCSRFRLQIAAKAYFYFARAHELHGASRSIRGDLHAALRTATLRADEPAQAVLMNALLRNYLEDNLVDQAQRLVSKTVWPESAGNSEASRFLYYLGRIKAIQLDYSEANTNLELAIRKAPKGAVGFLQVVRIVAGARASRDKEPRETEAETGPARAICAASVFACCPAVRPALCCSARRPDCIFFCCGSAPCAGVVLQANKLGVIVQMLLGEIPDRDIFRQKDLRRSLAPYFKLTQGDAPRPAARAPAPFAQGYLPCGSRVAPAPLRFQHTQGAGRGVLGVAGLPPAGFLFLELKFLFCSRPRRQPQQVQRRGQGARGDLHPGQKLHIDSAVSAGPAAFGRCVPSKGHIYYMRLESEKLDCEAMAHTSAVLALNAVLFAPFFFGVSWPAPCPPALPKQPAAQRHQDGGPDGQRQLLAAVARRRGDKAGPGQRGGRRVHCRQGRARRRRRRHHQPPGQVCHLERGDGHLLVHGAARRLPPAHQLLPVPTQRPRQVDALPAKRLPALPRGPRGTFTRVCVCVCVLVLLVLRCGRCRGEEGGVAPRSAAPVLAVSCRGHGLRAPPHARGSAGTSDALLTLRAAPAPTLPCTLHAAATQEPGG